MAQCRGASTHVHHGSHHSHGHQLLNGLLCHRLRRPPCTFCLFCLSSVPSGDHFSLLDCSPSRVDRALLHAGPFPSRSCLHRRTTPARRGLHRHNPSKTWYPGRDLQNGLKLELLCLLGMLLERVSSQQLMARSRATIPSSTMLAAG